MNPISTDGTRSDQLEWPVFGEQLGILAASSWPGAAGRDGYPISIDGTRPDQIERLLFGEQIDIRMAPANWSQTTNTNSIAGA
jgi:hypothetical protein